MKMTSAVLFTVLLASTPVPAGAEVPSKRVLTLEVAKRAAAAAEAEANRRKSTVVIVVADDAG